VGIKRATFAGPPGLSDFILLEAGFTVKEQYGGIAAWSAMQFPVSERSGVQGMTCDC